MRPSRRMQFARRAIKPEHMPDPLVFDSEQRLDLQASILGRKNPREPASTLPTAALCAVATALLFTIGGAEPEMWMCALFAPMPILAIAPELRIETAAELAFASFLVGNLIAWGGESFAVPLVTMLASHLAGAVVFAVFVVCAAEATRRWPGWLAALVFPTFETAFYYTLSLESPHGTWGSPAYSQVDVLPLLQTASWIGMCGVMFIISLLPSGLALACYRRKSNMDWTRPAMMADGLFAIAILFGEIRVILTPKTPAVRVAMIASAGLIPESESSEPIDAADIMTVYAKMVHQAAGSGAQIVVLDRKRTRLNSSHVAL